MWAAQTFIYLVYMFYGLFMYGYQGMSVISVSSCHLVSSPTNSSKGQYVINPSYLGIGQYNLQTAGNVFAMISALIAAALYGNIGIKGKQTSTNKPKSALT
jgi:hypothetical protein